MFTTAGLRRSAMSANEPAIVPVAAVGIGRTVARAFVLLGADWAGAGISDPATIKPTRNETVATRHTVTARNRLGIYANHYKGEIRARNWSSSSIGTPSCFALSALLPASLPT